MRTIEIPPVYLPGTTQVSSVRIGIELVSAEGQAIVGFDAAAGYTRPAYRAANVSRMPSCNARRPGAGPSGGRLCALADLHCMAGS
jgi:hypothetical protein